MTIQEFKADGDGPNHMKIAYLMLVHKNPRLLMRAIATLSTEDCAFFIHVDRKSDIREFSGIVGKNVFFIEPRIPAFWGEFTLVEATLRLIERALNSSANYDYCVLLLGSDYPLRSGRYIQEFLKKHQGAEFMSSVKIPAPGYPLSKINKLRYPSDKPVRRFVSRALAKVGFAHRDHRKHLGKLEVYAGDQSWTLSRDACQYIMEFVQRNPYVAEYFRNTFTSDEMFFHTILGNSPFHPRARRSLLFRDWPIENTHHPMLLNEAHISLFEEQDTICVQDQFGSGEVLFARKFCDEKLDLLDHVDAMIRRKEGANVSQ